VRYAAGGAAWPSVSWPLGSPFCCELSRFMLVTLVRIQDLTREYEGGRCTGSTKVPGGSSVENTSHSLYRNPNQFGLDWRGVPGNGCNGFDSALILLHVNDDDWVIGSAKISLRDRG